MTTNNGLLLIDKPQGLTSHDVVARARRLLGERRIGHAGTLDPMATGLLVLAVGPSTRLLRFAQASTKQYVGTVRFGVATNTLDADGDVTATAPVPELSTTEVAAATRAMCGTQRQIPPMVSALKVKGRRLHELAREGVEVERAAREITVDAFQVEPTSDADVWTFDVVCSTGTYVRVLLSDLAERLGTLGHLTSLRRVRSGRFDVHDALSLDDATRLADAHELHLAPPRAFVEHLEQVIVNEDVVRRLVMGQRVTFSTEFVTDEIAALDEGGALVGILVRRGEAWKPELVLADRLRP